MMAEVKVGRLGCIADTGRRLCWLNRSSSEVIRGIFYNKMNESLVTVSAFDTDDYKTLTCRSIPVMCAPF